jgi:hypothetical protein
MSEEQNVGDLDLNPNQLIEMFVGQWASFAPFSYSQYLKSGRGAVYVDLSMVKFNSKNRTIDPQIAYAPENNLQFLEAMIDEKTKNLLRTYDAEKMVVFLLRLKDNSIKTMFIGTENNLASPKELYENEAKGTIH